MANVVSTKRFVVEAIKNHMIDEDVSLLTDGGLLCLQKYRFDSSMVEANVMVRAGNVEVSGEVGGI